MEIGSVLVGKYLGEKAALTKPSPPAEDMELKKRTARVAGSDMTNSWLVRRMGRTEALVEERELELWHWLVVGGENVARKRHRVDFAVTCASDTSFDPPSF